MASGWDSASDSQKTNSLSNRSDSQSQADNEITDTEMKGYLMKRARLSRKWKRQWFLLKNCDLFYSQSPEVSVSSFCCFYFSLNVLGLPTCRM